MKAAGDISTYGTGKVTNILDPVNFQDAATVASLLWKAIVARAGTVGLGNVNLAAPGAALGGVTLNAGESVVIGAQTLPAENGIYIWNGAAVPMTRRADANSSKELEGAVISVMEGTLATNSYKQINVIPTLGIDPVSWSIFGDASGNPQIANFYALMPGDNAATIAIGAPVLFPQDGVIVGSDITRLTAGTFNLATVGNYKISFQGSFDEAGQLSVAIGGVGQAHTRVGRATGTNQIAGMTIINVAAPNTVISIINDASGAALTVTPTAGGASAVSANILIEKI